MRKGLRIVAYILGGLLVLIMLVLGWLSTDWGKDFLRGRIVVFLENKLKTEVKIGTLDYNIPNSVELGNVLFRDKNRDTLLAARKLRLEIKMLQLLNSSVEINEIQFEGGVAHIYRIAPDTAFNFDYIVKAFMAPPNPSAQNQPTDSSGQLKLDIKQLALKDIHVKYDDYTGGSRFGVDINDLLVTMNKIDPYDLDFQINTFKTNGLAFTMILDTSYLPPPPDTAAVPLPRLAAKELDLKNVYFKFQNVLDPFIMEYRVGSLIAHPNAIDLIGQRIAMDDFRLDSSSINIVMGEEVAEKAKQILDTLVDTDPSASIKWWVTANTLNLNGVTFKMDDMSQRRLPRGIDFAHLNARNITADINNLYYATDTITADIQHLALQEQSGLDIRELKTRLAYYPQGLYLRNLYVQTPQTLLRDNFEMRYPSIEALQNSPALVQMKVNLQNSYIGTKDLLIFAPDLAAQPLFKKYPNDRLHIDAVASGTLDNLMVDKLVAQGFGNTYVNVSGRLGNLMDPDKLNYNLNITRIQASRDLLAAFLPPAMLKQVNLPSSFTVSGRMSGTALSYNMDLVAVTSDGSATVRGTLAMGKRAGNERYDLAIKANNLNIGKIMRQESTLGRVTANVTAKGSSFDINYMNAIIKGDVSSIGLMGYNYKNIAFNANVKNKAADVNLDSRDPNAFLRLVSKIDFKNKYPAVVAQMIIDSADLQALNLYKEELRIRGEVYADISELNPDYPAGSIVVDNPTLVLKGSRYFLDSMLITATPSADSGNNIVVNADGLYAVLTGKVPLTQIGNIVQSHINRHYALNTSDSLKAIRSAPSSYNMNLNAVVLDRPLIRALVPGLTDLDSINIEANLSPNRLYANVAAPVLEYNGMRFQNANARVSGGDTGLGYNVTLDRFTQNNLEFWYSSASGTVSRNGITANVSIADSARKQRFGIAGIFRQLPDNTQEFSLSPGLMLNYKTWNVSQPNRVVIGKTGLYAENFRLSNGNESISLNSDAPNFASPLTVNISNFFLSNITEIISKDTLIANGVANGSLVIRNAMTAPEASGNLQIANLSVMNDTIGDLNAQLNQATANTVDARVTINGRGNDVAVNGFYYPNAVNGNNFDLDIKINTLNVQTLEGVAMNQIRNTTGFIRGDLKLTGTIAQPKLVGELRTDNLRTTITALGSAYSMPAERVRFTANGIEFENFRLVDSFGNSGVINGKIYTNDFKNMDLALRLDADRWQVLNSTKADNDMFYGRLLISSNLNINGTPLSPNIDGNLTVHDTTNFTIVMPQNEQGLQSREGVVEFVSLTDSNRYRLLAPRDTVPDGWKLNSNAFINMNVAIEKNAEINVVIDEGTGDFVKVRGEAALNAFVNPDGTIGLTGTYVLDQGYYELNYNFIKRRFNIQPGSSITFGGDPLLSQLNVTAIYEANVPPYDLVAKQVASPEDLNYYKQRLPFEVHLKLAGELMKPEITFDIVLPEEDNIRASSDVITLTQARLSQIRTNASELNKQVFALLLLNRFVSDNPFESGAGGTSAEFIARQSVTRFISEQLNQFTNNFVGGIDLNIDLQSSEDYTTGTRRNRTDLNVAASKRLLNDRLTLTVGNNFELEGENQYANRNSSLIPGNLAADYQLSQDGRYTIRIYRRNDLEDLLQGYVVETGSSFIMRVNYNRFRSIFMRRNRTPRVEPNNNNNNNNTGTGSKTAGIKH
jgi:hypothetical protein